MDVLTKLRALLRFRGQEDLAALLGRADLERSPTHSYAIITVPVEDYERLQTLSLDEKVLIQRALNAIKDGLGEDLINEIRFRLDSASLIEETPTQGLAGLIEAQRALMIAVATGGPRINAVAEEYRERQLSIRLGLAAYGIDDPNPYADLWGWYGKWSSGDLPSYQSRREYINDLYQPLIQRLDHVASGQDELLEPMPTGWAVVDRQLGEMRARLAEARTEEQFQAVGLLCRETLISLAQVVYDPARHPSIDGVTPSDSDGKRTLASYLAAEMEGSAHEVARRHAKAALDFANDLQHRRTASFRQAALCAEATSSVVNVIAIISGKRDP
jgi:hypothetical protein